MIIILISAGLWAWYTEPSIKLLNFCYYGKLSVLITALYNSFQSSFVGIFVSRQKLESHFYPATEK